MKTSALIILVLASVFPAQGGSTVRPVRPDPPVKCDDCEEWNAPHDPFRVFGNTYYVGVAGLSAVLIASDTGLILLDGALPQSAPRIDANVRALGFKTENIRLILNSHAHYDHGGGIAALQRASGATVAASAPGARALEQGYPTPDDPQYESSRKLPVAPVKSVRVVKDGEVLRVGELAVTAHLTPGHTPGSTTWTWRSCEGTRCLDIVYADSLNAVSDDGFRFTGDGQRASLVPSFERSITTVEQLPCDVLIAVHPMFSDLDGKLAKRKAQPDTNPFIDGKECRSYAGAARKRLAQRVAEEKQ